MEKVPPSLLVEYAPVRGDDGLETATLGLLAPITRRRVRHDQVKVNCTASVANAYWESRIGTVRVEAAQRLSLMESRDLLTAAADNEKGGAIPPILMMTLLAISFNTR